MMARLGIFLSLCLSTVTLTLVTAETNDSLFKELYVVESHVDAIDLTWNITEDIDYKELVVIHRKIDGDFTTFSSPQYNLTQDFTITDLISNTNYNVCVTVKMTDTAKCSSPAACRKCVVMSTIPVIRDDSLIAVILVLGMILLLILIGCFCWHYAKKKKAGELDEESESMIGSDESKQPILLQVPPTSNGPRRSVDFEDQDIPYITPPIEELKREPYSRNTSGPGTVV